MNFPLCLPSALSQTHPRHAYVPNNPHLTTSPHRTAPAIDILVSKRQSHAAARLVCRFGLAHDPAYRALLNRPDHTSATAGETNGAHGANTGSLATSEGGEVKTKMGGGANNDGDGDSDGDGVGTGQEVGGPFHHEDTTPVSLVDDVSGLYACRVGLFGNSGDGSVGGATVVGLDSEWRPRPRSSSVNGFGEGSGRFGGDGDGSGSGGREDWASTSARHPTALLQVSTRHHVYLLDTLALTGFVEPPDGDGDGDGEGGEGGEVDESSGSGGGGGGGSKTGISGLSSAYHALMRDLFCSPKILKIGFGFRYDLKRLAHTSNGPWSNGPVSNGPVSNGPVSDGAIGGVAGPSTDGRSNPFSTMVNILDLQTLPQELQRSLGLRVGGGLSSMVHGVLGAPLDKRMQCSDWQRRPLSAQQLRYASIDARCLVSLYDQMRGRGVELPAPITMEVKA